LSKTPEDLTAPSGAPPERARVDAPPPPGKGAASVSSGPGGPSAPPRRPRRDPGNGPASVAAQVPAEDLKPAPTRVPTPATPTPAPAAFEPIAEAEPTELSLDAEEEARPRRARRRAVGSSTTVRPTMAPHTQRQYRQTLVKVDLWSVTKLSLCFYLSAMFVTLVALIALWLIADAAGIIEDIEKFIGELLSAKKDSFQFLSAEVLRGTILIGLVVVAIQVIVTVVAASFYNIFAELFGGVEFIVREEEATPRT
jgi:hypothetical protein